MLNPSTPSSNGSQSHTFETLPALYHTSISTYSCATDTDSGKLKPVREALKEIACGHWQQDIERLRDILATQGKKEYGNRKKDLPAFTFSGTFAPKRKATCLQAWSGFLVIDADHCGGVQDITTSLRNDPCTAFFFVSPSNDGLKIAVHVPNITNDVEYKRAWHSVARWAKESHTITADPARKDINGLCFVSYDPTLYVNPSPVPFDIEAWQLEKTVQVAQNVRKAAKTPILPSVSESWSQKTAERKLDVVRRIVMDAPKGERHNARLRAARLGGGLIAGGWVQEADVWNILKTASDSVADGGATSQNEIKTLQDALDYGKRTPIYKEQEYEDYLTWLEQHSPIPHVSLIRRIERPENPHEDYINAETGEVLGISDADIWQAITQDEAGCGELLKKLMHNRAYDHTSNEWLVFHKGVWQPDFNGSTMLAIRTTLQSLFTQYGEAQRRKEKALREQNPVPSNEDDETLENKDQQQRLRRAKRADAAVRRLNKMRQMATIEKMFGFFNAVSTKDFDTDLYLLNCTNGILNLKMGTLTAHNPMYRVKKQSGCAYDLAATCPAWEDFLNTIFAGDKELITYLQQRLGLCLTGERTEQDVMFWYGSGANGKSVMMAILRSIFGSYFTAFPISTLLAYNRTSTTEYHLVRLQGARIGATSEIPQGSTLNEVAIKDMTGGEEIIARNPAGRPFTFIPTHQPIMIGNAKPRVNAQDEGTWRRLRIIPFAVTIPEQDRIPLPTMMQGFMQEASGILNWLYEGYEQAKEFERIGKQLPIPDKVRSESKAYREENDVLGDFLASEEAIETTSNPNDEIPLRDLYRLYKEWCDKNSIKIELRQTSQMSEEMQRRGFSKRTGTNNLVFIERVKMVVQKPY
jgi:P4 family phage/plasmid primase-like protien